MKAVIFAGGVGTRLWPLSRKKSPKQFERVVGDKSTLQLAVDRLLPEFNAEDIYICTGSNYAEMVLHQLPDIPKENVIAEPAKKDVGPAVALAMAYLAQKFPKEPVVILWSDHLVKHTQKFKDIIFQAGEFLKKDSKKMIFIGQKPRFASENLGWIEMGDQAFQQGDYSLHNFVGFKYKPNREVAQRYFKDSHLCWNLGYFVSTPEFILSLFARFSPSIYEVVENILSSAGGFQDGVLKNYADMPEIHFDNAILEQIDHQSAYVVSEDIGWSDVGAWEALKEALEQNREDNITKGKVMIEGSSDNLVYNYEDKKLIVGIDLDDLLVVNTDDVLLVARKTSVAKIKKLVESFQGTEHEVLT